MFRSVVLLPACAVDAAVHATKLRHPPGTHSDAGRRGLAVWLRARTKKTQRGESCGARCAGGCWSCSRLRRAHLWCLRGWSLSSEPPHACPMHLPTPFVLRAQLLQQQQSQLLMRPLQSLRPRCCWQTQGRRAARRQHGASPMCPAHLLSQKAAGQEYCHLLLPQWPGHPGLLASSHCCCCPCCQAYQAYFHLCLHLCLDPLLSDQREAAQAGLCALRMPSQCSSGTPAGLPCLPSDSGNHCLHPLPHAWA
mmetsp:Transcript_23061/g.63686  ORF Transcript_23061/g.63686 Transcript_23061/m.63686 type:complete len:251 (-) Transcript_23061:743-1495(-)